ncbi:MAG TPA: nuclear transport factor 2 family protein [Candidatus Sulfotelmatobacter sp.]
MYRPYSGSLADPRPYLDVESVIRGLTQDYVTSYNTGNYDQIGALFAPDGVIMAPHMEPGYGPKSVERLARQMADAGYENLRSETLRVDHSGDMAMEIGRYTVAIRQADGTTVADRGKYVKVWRRLGRWMIVADCWNSNMPGMVKAA